MSEQSSRFTHHAEGVVYEPARALHWTAEDAAEDRVNYADAEKAVAKLNEQAFGGFTDWRLPTVEELFLLADRTRFDPAIDTEFFPTCKSSWYWTSTPDAEAPSGYAWSVYFNVGLSGYDLRFLLGRVRAVRGPSRQ